MSTIHVRHIRSALENLFSGKVDLSDYDGKAEEQRQDVFLSRSLAGYVLMQLIDITSDIAGQAIVDGFDDNGIDAIHFDQSEKVFYVVQSKWMASGNGTPERGEVQKFIKGFQDLIEAKFDRFNAKVQSKKSIVLSALDDSQTKFTLVVAYTGQQPLSTHAQRDLDDLLKELNDPTEVVSLRTYGQKELHIAVSGQAEGDPINIEVVLHDWGQSREPFLAYYGQIEASSLAEWWQGHGSRLCARNLRKFIGNTEINEAIMNSLKSTPEKFWYLNNGVTILCTKLSKKLIGGSERATGVFECEGISIVNGAQTAGCIAAAYSTNPEDVKKARVAVRLISLENCPEGFASEVTRATNTQNRIERRDFVSLDPEQHRLRTELWLDSKKEYLYKSGDPTPNPDKGCNIEEATVALACSNPDVSLAVQAKREIGKLWENIEKAPYKLLFSPALSALRLWRSVEVLRIVEGVLKEKQASLSGRDRMVAVHGNRFILHRVFSKMPMDRIDDASLDFDGVKKMAREETGKSLEGLISKVNELFPTSMLHSLFKNLTKCRELEKA